MAPALPEEISPMVLDAVRELINIGVGKAAGILSELTGSHVLLQVPTVVLTSEPHSEIATSEPCSREEKLATVQMQFEGSMAGTMAIFFPPASAANLVILLTGESDTTAEMDLIRAETLTEIGNIIINGVMGTISNFVGEPLLYSLPSYEEIHALRMVEHKEPGGDEGVLVACTEFRVRDREIHGNLVILLKAPAHSLLIGKIQQTISDLE